MNLPNLLTLSRIGFAAIIVYLLMLNTLAGNAWAAVFFVIASITDFFDGYLAKKQGLVSDFGKIMDPIADKVLMLSIFTVLANIGLIQWWMVALIAVREVAVTVDRLWAMTHGYVSAAEQLGKIKTVLQILTVGVIFVYLILEQVSKPHSWFLDHQNNCLEAIQVLMGATVVITIWSGISYWQGRNRKKSQ